MSMQRLIDVECGGENPLMKLGGHVSSDVAFRDGGVFGGTSELSRTAQPDENSLITEYLTQFSQPQSFSMGNLLQEMREIDIQRSNSEVVSAPTVIQEVIRSDNWATEFTSSAELDRLKGSSDLESVEQKPSFEAVPNLYAPGPYAQNFLGDHNYHLATCTFEQPNFAHSINEDEFFATEEKKQDESRESWIQDFEDYKAKASNVSDPSSDAAKSADYNQQFWTKLQDEWKKISENQSEGLPWLSEFTDYYDPYKEYSFAENNPMTEDKNALSEGKAYLAKGDIPSAVLCFEAAVKQEPNNEEAWELLGLTQAENEMDPNAICALKKALEINPNNSKVLMALAVSYTNESLQSQALRMLIKWLQCNPKYSHLVQTNVLNEDNSVASSIIRGPELKETQDIFLQAVNQNPEQIDADIQEALGVLFNLSSEYDKAADCFRAALHVRPDNAKTWNRLGASLANGNRSVEAVDAYQKALSLEPGFIRARYNVGIICMNLKSYKEAAGHLLTALNLQATSASRSGTQSADINGESHISDTIWSTFRMIVSLMGRRDLQDVMDKKDLDTLNRALEEI